MFGGLSRLLGRSAANHGDEIIARVAANKADDLAEGLASSGALNSLLPEVETSSAMGNMLRAGGKTAINAPMDLVRTDMRKMRGKGSDPDMVISTLFDRTGTSDVNKLEQIADSLMGSKDGKNKGLVSSVVDDMRTNFSRVGDPQNYVDLSDMRELIQNTAKDAKLESVIQDKLGIIGEKPMDPIAIAKAFRSKAADYRGGATPNKNMAAALEDLGRTIDQRIDDSVDPRNIAGGWDIIQDNLLHAQQAATRSGDKAGAEAYKRLAKEIADVPAEERTIGAMRSKLKDFVDIKEINQLTDNGSGGGALSTKLKALPFAGEFLNAAIGGPVERATQKVGEKMLKAADAFDNGTAQKKIKGAALAAGGVGALAAMSGGKSDAKTTTDGLPMDPATTGQAPQLPQQPGQGGVLSSLGVTGLAQQQPTRDPVTVGGYDRNQLEDAYAAALMDNNPKAAQAIATMIGIAEKKEARLDKQMAAATKATKKGSGNDKADSAMQQLNASLGNYQSQGVVGGALTNLLNKATGGAYDPKSAAYNEQAESTGVAILRALGDTGALSDQDMKRAKALLPATTDSKEKAQVKLQTLKEMLASAQG